MKGCRTVIGNEVKSQIKSKFTLLKITCCLLLLLGSYKGLAQTQSEILDRADVPHSAQVNINLADAETIAMVRDGVGLNRAEAIVDYREANGDFKAIDELIMVSGI